MLIAESDEDILACFDVMKELRENLRHDNFISTIRFMQKEGYSLGYLKSDDKVVSVAGFRVCFNFAAEGNALYVYDLVTSSQHRSMGFGDKLLRALTEFAVTKTCTLIHLDSGIFRFKAHKFYLGNDFEIRAHHFIKRLGEN